MAGYDPKSVAYQQPMGGYDPKGAVYDAKSAMLSPGMHCQAVWNNGQYYGGTLLETNGSQWLVQWDDGSQFFVGARRSGVRGLSGNPGQARGIGKVDGRSNRASDVLAQSDSRNVSRSWSCCAESVDVCP